MRHQTREKAASRPDVRDVDASDQATIRKIDVRREKHDRRDANLLLKLLVEDRFPAIWMPSNAASILRR
jgi:hypothetical protein